ncbi:CAP domain-containing protein [Pseudogemmobacter sonorensis]|uniref:CAP domain-containing protein n=1 Tax=Pseudogemmobacter sonorensis TaxID=2989681 RepID=UPI00367C3B62
MFGKAGMAGLGLMLMTLPALACTLPPGAAAHTREILSWANAERAARSLPRLAPSQSLTQAAQGQACDLADMGRLTHSGKNGSDLRGRLRGVGYRLRTAVENIASSSQGGAAPAMRLWRESAGHWANLLNPQITEAGIAIATDGTRTYYVFVGAAPR